MQELSKTDSGEKRGGDVDEAVENDSGGERNTESNKKENSQGNARPGVHQVGLEIAQSLTDM